MATLNATPDSFSDGSLHLSPSTALQYARESVLAGASIIDVGGYSTRPGAAYVSPSEEIARVVPVIRAIRSAPEEDVRKVLVRVDTFRPEVAAAAIEAGANCVNDVYAFTGPEWPVREGEEGVRRDMCALARRTGVPVVMMHSRGDAGKNKDYSAFEVANDEEEGRSASASAVLQAVRLELGAKVQAVLGRAGLRRWQVIVDPGIGFSKTMEDNLELLRGRLTRWEPMPAALASKSMTQGSPAASTYATPGLNPLAGFPVLIGTSRKSFLGSIIAEPLPQQVDNREDSSAVKTQEPVRSAKERDFATAAAIVCAVQQGAAVIRVHAVKEMVEVVKVASALWP